MREAYRRICYPALSREAWPNKVLEILSSRLFSSLYGTTEVRLPHNRMGKAHLTGILQT